MSNSVKRAHKNLTKRSARKYPSENNSGHASIKGHISHATISYIRIWRNWRLCACLRLAKPHRSPTVGLAVGSSELVHDKGRIVPADRAILPIPLIMEEFQPFAGQLITSRVPGPPPYTP